VKYIFLIFLTVLFASYGCGGGQSGNMDKGDSYFPPPDSLGGWRTLTQEKKIKNITGIDKSLLDSAFAYIRTTTRNGGLLVVRHGYLVYENYFGLGQRNATPNLASCGKSFTSISFGILMSEHPELFPEGLDQKIFTPAYLPEIAFPLPDARMADIKLGQLLSFSAGIRGNNPVYVKGVSETIEPVGPDGWYSMVDSFALGIKEGKMGDKSFSTKTLWCEPGGGYSYASASIHIASIILRHIAGTELRSYIENHLALPMGWGIWGYGYRNIPQMSNTPGGGGIALRSTDMLRFCYLLLHKGKWRDKQIVPEDYIIKASNASSYNPHYPYSLQFNVNTNGEADKIPKDAFWKGGSGGHCFFVVPSLDLVVWKLGGRDGQYGTNDTGLPQPEKSSNAFGPTEKITAKLDGSENEKTLELVLRSILIK
jgi:CubicO group peptidase (beta-lactamase class C family)